MDPKLEKVEPVATPVSKRTSTVFGKTFTYFQYIFTKLFC